jgi:hypothetical protein
MKITVLTPRLILITRAAFVKTINQCSRLKESEKQELSHFVQLAFQQGRSLEQTVSTQKKVIAKNHQRH